MDKIIANTWLSLQCQMIPGVCHAVFAADVVSDGTFVTVETWPEGAEAPSEVLDTLRAAMASEDVEVREPNTETGAPIDTHWVVACPLRRDGVVYGGVAVEVEGLDTAQVPVVTQLMKWGSAWPAFLADQDAARRNERIEPVLSVVSAVLESEDFRAATAAAATVLAREFEVDRAMIGIYDGQAVRVHALSGRTNFDRRSDRVRQIERAMNEACDQNCTVVWPAMPGFSGRVGEAHARLSAGADDSSVCSIPLRAHGRSSGALTLLRPRNQPMGTDEVVRAETLAALLGPAIETQRRADRGALSRMLDTTTRIAGKHFGPGLLRIKIATASAVALLAFLGFASGAYDVPAEALLEGTVERQLVAPMDSFVTQALVRAGTRVRAGDTLATLDDEALKLEHRHLESQRDELTNEYNLALGELDRGAIRVLQAQIAQTEALLALVKGELERTRIIAPFDGLVVSGDLSQSIGSPVSRGDLLFRLAPLDGYRVILQLTESDVPVVRLGMTGRLVLAALPGKQFDIRVEWVNGMAKIAEGRNVLEVEATLVGNSEHLRPGMRGAARLDAGRARLLWIWTHRLLDRIRLWFWAWSPVA